MSCRFLFLTILGLATCISSPPCMYGARKGNNQPICENMPFVFMPPKKWQCITDKEALPRKVEAVYIGNGINGFAPSINIASEETELSLENYTNLAKHYHENRPDTLCYHLGSFPMNGGEGSLLQIEQKTQWGKVKYLQAAHIFEKKAYVLTATCLEADYDSYYPLFLQSFKSFALKSPMETLQHAQ